MGLKADRNQDQLAAKRDLIQSSKTVEIMIKTSLGQVRPPMRNYPQACAELPLLWGNSAKSSLLGKRIL